MYEDTAIHPRIESININPITFLQSRHGGEWRDLRKDGRDIETKERGRIEEKDGCMRGQGKEGEKV